MTLDSADVIVVGGGIVGASAAYFLRRRGFDVVLLEQRFMAYGASGRNSGCVWIQTMRGGAELDLARAGAAMYPGFIDELGPTFEYRREGGLLYFETEQQRDLLTELAANRQRHGVPVELLDGEAARSLAPAVPDSAIGALYCGEDAQLNVTKFVRGLADACRRLGVRVHENTPVLGLLRTGDAVRGVRTVRGEVSSQAVLWATGGWSTSLAAEGVTIPTTPVRMGLIMTQPVFPRARAIVHGPLGAGALRVLAELPTFGPNTFPDPAKEDGELYAYHDMVAQTLDGSLQFGHSWDAPGSLNPHTTLLAAHTMIGTLLARRPSYGELGVTGLWSGLVATTSDGLPIIDAVDDLPGLYLATGHTWGNATGPITGELVAQYIAGEPTTLPLATYRLDRPSLDGFSQTD